MSSSSPPTPRVGGKQRLLLRIERFSRSHYKLVFLMAALAVVIVTVGVWIRDRVSGSKQPESTG